MAKTRLKDLTKTLTYAQWLASFSPADSAANGTGKSLGQTIADGIRGGWSVVTFTTGTDITGVWVNGTLTATAGTLYEGTAVSALTLALVAQSGGQYHLRFATAASIGAFDFSVVTSWIGDAPNIAASKTYEIDILDGVGICAEVS